MQRLGWASGLRCWYCEIAGENGKVHWGRVPSEGEDRALYKGQQALDVAFKWYYIR